ncbi:DNA-directed DNA polymerase gamma MIP1 [Lachancea thermotolerans CBS 6340]|uniref:DNA polymerase gamma n=1 Tax=Lachancea thermotolerans (strain ATCC 56472 / CBS 6340 / NRRL Y-8284) TaxID=559295 RepID=C5DG30_LACTC|nr:KLTH0D01980p [Lachancea thermotolerans CBS 6340]CAR22372.1 KLTH0D01980p [Lachancea thermotolerans CBS 6340]
MSLNRAFRGVKLWRKVRAYSTLEAPRINPVGIQHLSKHLHEQVFGSINAQPQQPGLSYEEKEMLTRLSRTFLKNHGLLGKKTAISAPISFDLPQLQGRSLDEHFQKLGHFASQPYRDLAGSKFTNIPPRPKTWLRKSGWVRYASGKAPEAVDYPAEATIVFDVETLYKISPYPTLAVALSEEAWYCWTSPFLSGESDNPSHLIPLNTLDTTRLVIGHNVGYDRARVLEEYNCQESKAFFLDTMSLHVASSGMCSRQRPQWMQKRKAQDSQSCDGAQYSNVPDEEDPWTTVSTLNSLKDVALLHCGIKLDKAQRDYFATLDRNDIINDFTQMVDYCATDVEATSKVFDVVFPLFLSKCPHPVSFGALRLLSTSLLTTRGDSWKDYIEKSENLYQHSKQSIEKKILAIVEEVVKLKDKKTLIEQDPWLSQLDWTIKPLRITKKGLPAKGQKLPGYPEWYRQLFPTKNSKQAQITIRNRLIPLFFKLSWEGEPVIWTSSHGWCFAVPVSRSEELEAKNYLKINPGDVVSPEFTLFKVPHPNGQQFNCTTLVSKQYVQFFEKGILTSHSELAHEALKINSSCAYWISARERVMSQFVVSTRDFPDQFKDLQHKTFSDEEISIILPSVIPMGTVTRRSVENTWLTASNAKKNRIGSELKAQVQAPPGYVFVGADVDSEELWIASLVSDSVFNIHGGTPIGWMCLEGSKSEGTDMHTKTAQILGCSRNEAKIFNYGRIYGAGVKFATQLLKNFNPGLTDYEAKETAEKLYSSTKGLVKRSKTFKKFWYSGSESILFNKLEHIAEQAAPRTPVLGAGITSSLMKGNLGSNTFLPSRINWAIQSSGVDYLHLLCCSMNYLIKKFSLRARLALSIHDEIRFLTAEKDKYKTAMALQISNLWTRAVFCEQMGIKDLPQNCAFFSAVDIDHVMRKEVDMDCVTPSNKIPIPHGESKDIVSLLKIPESSLKDGREDIDVSGFPFQKREPVFSTYDKAHSRDYLYYFLRMQIQSSKWKVEELEQEFTRRSAENDHQSKYRSDEYMFLDYINDTKNKNRPTAELGGGPLENAVHGSMNLTLRTQPIAESQGKFTDELASGLNVENDLEAQHFLAANNTEDTENTDKVQRCTSAVAKRKRLRKSVFGGAEAYKLFSSCVDKSRAYAGRKQEELLSSDLAIKTIVNEVVATGGSRSTKKVAKIRKAASIKSPALKKDISKTAASTSKVLKKMNKTLRAG